MKSVLTTSLALLLCLGSSAIALHAQASKDGAITPKLLEELRQSEPKSSTEKALHNAIAVQGMQDFFINNQRPRSIEDKFSVEVQSSGIADQKQSGRCWLFTGLNVLRAQLMTREKSGTFFFSQNYSFFWDQLEKSNLFLEGIIETRKLPINDAKVEWLFKNPINDGGQFTGISDNLYKYGVVPAEVMPETASSNNTKLLGKMLARTLRQTGIQLRKASEKGESLAQLRKRKEDGLKKVYRLLSLNLGVPPTSFTYTLKDKDGKAISTETYTPQSFYERFVGADLRGQFVMLMNDPSRPYYKVYEIEYDRHAYDGKNWTYVNLPMDEIKQMAIASLKDNTMMYYSCDVGRELDRSQGIAALDNYDYASLLGYPFDMDKAERIQTFDSGSTHAMTLKAVDLDASGKPVKWKVENSWGEKTGVKGHIIMTDAWFDAYTFRLVVNKKYATQKVLDLLKTKPVQLPAWDPMFAPDAP
ncbi:MAG: C1 family peptidase [Porphyromonadaceae bacterium]|nr:C1 family peptidase [Porphyromonadaceae bacterium]